MKVLLVYPWYPYASVTTFEEPVGILYLAAVLLKEGHQVEVADLTFAGKLEGLAAKAKWAEVVGISAPSPLFGTAIEVLEHVKQHNPTLRTVIGGPHATVDPGDALRAGFDVAVMGEGEVTLGQLLRAWESGEPWETVKGLAFRREEEIYQTPPQDFISDLDSIPFPERKFIDYTRYRRLGIISMRGCPFRCLYCKPVEEQLFGKKLRQRSLENVVAEITYLLKTYGNRQISFKDDTLTIHKTEWFLRLGEEFRRNGLRVTWQCSSRVDTVDLDKLRAMKAAGCRQIFFGIESGSQRILDYYRKDITVERIIETFALCRQVGIKSCASIMLGAPSETREDLEKTYQLVKRIRPFNWHVHVTTPICGSYLYDWALSEGRIGPGGDYHLFEPTGNLYRGQLPMKLDYLTAQDVITYRDRINRSMKFRLILACLVDLSFWREILVSRGLRTIVRNFIGRHFNPLKSRSSRRASNLPGSKE